MADNTTGQERDILSYLEKLEEEAREFRRYKRDKWSTYSDFKSGEHWPFRRPAHKNNFTYNIVDLVIEKSKGILTDAKPTIYVRSNTRGLEKSAEVLEETIRAWWDETSFDRVIERFVGYAALYGHVGSNVHFNPTHDFGRGEIVVSPISPYNLLIDPYVVESERAGDGEFFIITSVMPISEIRQRFGKRGAEVKEDKKFSTFEKKGTESETLVDTGSRPLKIGADKQRPSAIPRAMVKEYWIRDRVTNTSGGELDLGNRKVADGELIYPGGRHIIEANGTILVDEHNPYYDGRFPIDVWDWRTDMNDPLGESEVKNIMSLQKNINKMGSAFMENAMLMNNGIWIGDRDALAPSEWDNLSDRPGLQVKVKAGRQLRRESPQPLPPHQLEVMNLMINLVEQLTGIQDPQSVPQQSGVAIETIALMAQTMIRQRARSLESFISRIMQKVIPRIFQFYSNDRILHTTGPDGEYKQFVFDRETLIKNNSGSNIQDMFKDYKFTIVPGSSLAVTKTQKGLLAGQLFSSGAIDREALLDTIEFPNRDMIMERMDEAARQQQEAMMQAQQQAAATGAKPPPNPSGSLPKFKGSVDGKALRAPTNAQSASAGGRSGIG